MIKEKLGIYGGTFSPIHFGHVNAAYNFLDSMSLDRLLIVPTSVHPQKAVIEGASVSERIEMARLAFADADAYREGILDISDCEASREGTSYTVLTLEQFTSPERALYLLVGTDMFFNLDKWYRAADIFSLADIVLMRRENDTENYVKIKEKTRFLLDNFGARVHEIDEPPLVMSSTEVRERLKQGRDVSGLVPEAVIRYIEENGLYKGIVL